MTTLYTLALPGEQSRESGQEVVLATDKHTGQVLFYQVGGQWQRCDRLLPVFTIILQRSGNTAYNFPIELFQHDQVLKSYYNINL